MLLVKKIQGFGASSEEMVDIWKTYCRSILEQSAIVWGPSLTEQNKSDLERTQQSFVKLVSRNKYTNYEESYIRHEDFLRSSVLLRHAQGTPLYSEKGWTGELWSNHIFRTLEN